MKNNSFNTATSADVTAQQQGFKSAAEAEAAKRAARDRGKRSKAPAPSAPKPAAQPAPKKGALGRLLDGFNGKY